MNYMAVILSVLMLTILPPHHAQAEGEGIYRLSVTIPAVWDGAGGDRLADPGTGYDYTYGDESFVTFALPWNFNFYGLSYGQITADTNGNIWFGYAGTANSFDLANNGKGPVIAAWNDDLSSTFEGGVFIRHKSDPERVVIEWRSESYSDEGFELPNAFEVVLYPSGDIRIDYESFSVVEARDSGSGISNNNDTSTSITSPTAPVYLLAGSSHALTKNSLALNFGGNGNGTVTSTPPGITCNTGCYAEFPFGTQYVTLHPAADQYSIFGSWSNGPCSGTGDCLLALNGATSATADFDRDISHQISIDGVAPAYYSTIQAAYDAAADGSIIKLWGITYNESLDCNRSVEVTLRGGYDGNYSAITGETMIAGSITVTDGSVIMDGVSLQ